MQVRLKPWLQTFTKYNLTDDPEAILYEVDGEAMYTYQRLFEELVVAQKELYKTFKRIN